MQNVKGKRQLKLKVIISTDKNKSLKLSPETENCVYYVNYVVMTMMQL